MLIKLIDFNLINIGYIKTIYNIKGYIALQLI